MAWGLEWLDGMVRINPGYRVVDIRDMSSAEMSSLADDSRLAGMSAILVPTLESGLGMKAVCAATHSLLQIADGRQSVGQLMRQLRDAPQPDDVASLVVDRILEVEVEGSFVSGAAAGLLPAPEVTRASPSMLATLSRQALQAASHLAERNESLLTWALYNFGRQPLTPKWRRLIPDPAGARAYLGLDDSTMTAVLRNCWRASAGGRPVDGWLSWGRARSERTPSRFKLYMSPQLATLPGIMPDVVACISEHPVSHFKVGADVAGLLRPDKFVAYLPSREALESAGNALVDSVAGRCEPHGVPFTVQIGADPTVSWGRDPQPGEPAAEAGHSWRSWLCSVAARALAATRGQSGLDPVEFALGRLRLEGIDTATWQPMPSVSVAWPVEALHEYH